MINNSFESKDVNMIETGKHLRKLRLERHKKIADLQEFFNLDYPQAIYNWEQGKRIPNLSNLLALADYYEVTIDSLIIRRK